LGKNDLISARRVKGAAMVTIICLKAMKHDAMGFNVMMHVPKLPDF
jgi:hypothetical protein